MTLRNPLTDQCWARLAGLRCEKWPDHVGLHTADGVVWADDGPGPVIDVGGLDGYGDDAA